MAGKKKGRDVSALRLLTTRALFMLDVA